MTPTWDDFLVRSLTQPCMEELRDKLVRENDYFLHKARSQHIEAIITSGLMPQPGYLAVMPAWVKAAGKTDEVLFVTPSRSTKPMNVTGADILLAFSPESLPTQVGIDWTYPNFLSIAAHRYGRLVDPDPIRFAIDVMTEHSTVLCYDGVLPTKLRRWDGLSSVTDPMSWPALV